MSDEESETELIARLTRERGTQRGQATKLINQTNTIVNTQTSQQPDLQQIRRNVKQLQQKIEKIQEYNEEIRRYVLNDDEYYKAADEAETSLQQKTDRKLFYEQYVEEKSSPRQTFQVCPF